MFFFFFFFAVFHEVRQRCRGSSYIKGNKNINPKGVVATPYIKYNEI